MNYSKESTKKKEKDLNSKTKKVKKSISTSFTRIILFLILLSLGIFICAGLGITTAVIDSAPKIDYNKDIMPKGYTTFIYDQIEKEIAKIHGTDANRIYASMDKIPKHLCEAFIAIEDERFYTHKGIDFRGIFRAIIKNIKEKNLTGEGASTITQQVIKNNVLTSEQTFERKIQEQYLAIELEKRVNKQTILESYLNTVALGRGTNGVQSASLRYYNKDVSKLTIAESAVLAGITKYPTRYDPISNPDNNRSRQIIVLKKMLEQKSITQEEYDEAIEEDVYSKIQVVSEKNTKTNSNYSYFVDEVIKRVKNDLVTEKGYTDNQAYDLIYRGGLNIYITQDKYMQNIVDKEFLDESNYPPRNEDYLVKLIYSLSVQKKDDTIKNYYKEKEFKTDEEAKAYINELKKLWVQEGDSIICESPILVPQPQSAMVIIDYHTGHVKAIAGGRGEKVGNQLLNRATSSRRHPGSTFKILAAYLPAIDTGKYTLATVLDDVPFTYTPYEDSTPWDVHNWYDSDKYKYNYKGLSTVREGITWSMNVHAVKTILDVGIDKSFDYLLNLGFTSLVESKVIKGKTYTDKTPSLALGGLTEGVSLLELSSAYGAIANNGKYVEPIFYTKVLDHDGNIIFENKQAKPRQVMKETTAFLLTDAMTDVIKKGTGTIVKFRNVSMPIAGKTGTSSEKKDLVFSGYTPYYVASIWQGYDTPKDQVYKKSYHKILWRKIMEEIHKGLPRKEFNKPAGIVTTSICKESGKLAVKGLCDKDPRGSTIITEYFEKGTVPTETCDVHHKHTMCYASNLFANEYCPDDNKYERVFIARPNPLIKSTWDTQNPPRIEDAQYELPDIIDKYCNVHTSKRIKKHIKLPFEFFKNNNLTDEDMYYINEEEETNTQDNNNLPYTNDDYYSPPPFIYQE
ncbi:MAG: PBP1A family penicillin-binding protein [Vallitalea sp.]|jgi:penicillin-binding protein 1A|nr:PBP1A family penicillin-binding protein [Vallitalea sp.]